ncbi:dihydroorotate oxidase A [Kribbella orskensis]|uniref:Dihydroorotate dehydrogenase (quinone) n=1 Tax=Kribbella orskensis TaxID=2512216 RepID=A0ABY2BNR4_9ACTN|nr:MULTISPECIES: quinone-dependent dihydroorotate dehydrogenase [Kribbella]TCN42020.1 dihydroorotate oxidase A [Kribbella sp. VKM Ac-2500]TCO25898.1 dihydroorotate oxidase A [Kribbella orskensis]
MYRKVIRPVLYRLGKGDAEVAHEQTLHGLRRLSRVPGAVSALSRSYGSLPAGLERTVFGVRFPSPVGLAAGMDKNGVALPAWRALGFGFVEVGTVTAHAQPGNEKPRLFRLVESEAVINRMGFNNLGSAALADRLAQYGDLGYPLGVSIGKSKVTPLEDAVEDYVTSLRRLYRFGDYFAVNVSSPNTPGLRSLQDSGHLRELLTALHAEAEALSSGGRGPKPILVKIAPDLTEQAIDELLGVCTDVGVAGIIATNTTIGRAGLAPADERLAGEAGGLSGRPLTEISAKTVAHIYAETGGALPIIGVGGILDPADAARLLDAGASLVQLYTGLIYRGPGLIRRTNRNLAAQSR